MMPYDFDHLVMGNSFSDNQPKFKGLLQMSLVYLIARRTWGDKTRPEYWKIPVRKLAAELGAEPRNVAIDLADAKARGILTWPEREGCRQNTPKMYRLTPEGWFRAPKYEAPAPAVVEAVAAAAEEEETPQTELHRTTQPEPPAPEATKVVAPGKTTRTRISISMEGQAQPYQLPVSYHNLLDVPTLARWSFDAQKGLIFEIDVVAHDYIISPSIRPSKTVQPAENPDFTAYSEYLDTKILELWSISTDQPFKKQIWEKANGAPLHVFQAVVEKRLPTPRAAAPHKHGLLLNLAGTAAKTWEIMQRKAAAAPPRPVTPEPTPEETAAAEEAWKERIATLEAEAAAAATRCQGCKGTGKREHAGVKGEYLNCGLCRGTGKKTE